LIKWEQGLKKSELDVDQPVDFKDGKAFWGVLG